MLLLLLRLCLRSGKDFAKRMTFWDVVFGVGGRGRDEELAATLLRWLGVGVAMLHPLLEVLGLYLLTVSVASTSTGMKSHVLIAALSTG